MGPVEIEPVKSGEILVDDPKIAGLSPEEELKLYSAFRRGDQSAREKLIDSITPLAIHMATKYVRPGIEFEDLRSVALIGACIAVDKCEPERGKLSNLAYNYIRNELNALAVGHDNSVDVPGYLKGKIRNWIRMKDQLAATNGKQPTELEIAEACHYNDKTVALIRKAIDSQRTKSAGTYQGLIYNKNSFANNGEVGEDGMEQLSDNRSRLPDHDMLIAQDIELLMNSIKYLPILEQMVINMYFGINDEVQCTVEKIGEKIGYCAATITTILHRAFDKIRKNMADKVNTFDA